MIPDRAADRATDPFTGLAPELATGFTGGRAALPSAHAPVAALARVATKMSPQLVVLLLALTLGIQPVATDLYLPALPALTAGFGASMPQAQLTLTALLLAFGISQLFWGPVSDRYGRRPVLLVGLAGFGLAAVACAAASSIGMLIVLRAVQGAAMGASVMCARAMLRDLYNPTEGAIVMSRGLTGLGIIACVSPLLGGLVSDLLNWRAAMGLLGLFAAGTLALVALRFEETVAQKNPVALQPKALLTTWLMIARHPTFQCYALLASCTYGGLFTFLATSSFVFINVLHISKTAYGGVMLVMCLAYMGGTVLCRRLLARIGLRRTVAVGAAFSLCGGLCIAVLAWLGVQTVASILLPFCLFAVGHGIAQPCGQSGAVGPFPANAGAASALSGFIMMVVAFVTGSYLGTHMDGTVFPLTHGVLLWGVLVSGVAWGLVPRLKATPA